MGVNQVEKSVLCHVSNNFAFFELFLLMQSLPILGNGQWTTRKNQTAKNTLGYKNVAFHFLQQGSYL
jgi:hypothetical protein